MVEELKKVSGVGQNEAASKASETKQVGENKSIWTSLREQMGQFGGGGRNDEQIQSELKDITDEKAAYKMQLGQTSPFVQEYKDLTEAIKELDVKASALNSELEDYRANSDMDSARAAPKFNFET